MSTSSFAASKRLPSASSTRTSDSHSSSLARSSSFGVYSETRHPDHAAVGAAKLVELTQKLVMKRMQKVLEDIAGVQWQSSTGTFHVELPMPLASAPQPWMHLHRDTDEIIIKLEWEGSAPAVADSTRAALIQSLGEPAAVDKLRALCGQQRPSVPDIDLSVVMLDDKLAVMDVVYYNNLCSRDCSLLHSGDSSAASTSSESAVITLSKVSASVHAIAFGINLHGSVPASAHQQRAVSTEGRPSSAHAPKSEQPADCSASLDALQPSDVLWVPETCCLRVFSTAHSFLLASYDIEFVASDDVWNPKLTRRPMSGGGRMRMMSKSSSLDDLADCDADVMAVTDSDGDAAWDEMDHRNESSRVCGASSRRAGGRFLGSSLRTSVQDTRISTGFMAASEQEAGTHAAESSRDLVEQVSAAASQAETACVNYIDWISFLDKCDATGDLHVPRDACLAAFRAAAAAAVTDTPQADSSSVSTHPLPLLHFAAMLQKTLLPLVRQSEYKLPSPSALRQGMEAMCASFGLDCRPPLSEQVIDIARVQRGANVFCLHRGNQSGSFAASVAAENRSAGKQSSAIERWWYLQTLGSVTLAVNLVQNLASLREQLVMSGVFIPVIVAVEYCTAERPSVSLRGKSSHFSRRFESLKARVERSLPFVKVEANPAWMLPAGPRISAFEVFVQDPSNMHCVCIHSKSESKRWPDPSQIIAKLHRLMQSREKRYKLPVDLCPLHLACKSSFNHMQPLPAAAVHIHRVGDEDEIADIAAIAGAPAARLHSLRAWQGDGVAQYVTSDPATLCISGRSASDGVFSTRLSAGVYVATIGNADMVPEHMLLFVRTLQKEAVVATVAVKPRLFRLSGRVIDGSSGSTISHGCISIRSASGGGEDVVVQLQRADDLINAASSKSPVPLLPISTVPQPDTFSDSERLSNSSCNDESPRSQSAASEPSLVHTQPSSVSVPPAAGSAADASDVRPLDGLDIADTVASTIDAVINGSLENVHDVNGESGSPYARSDKRKQIIGGSFEAMLPHGDYTLSVNVRGYSAGGVFKVSMRRGALHMGIITVHPDHDLLLLNNLRDLRAKKCFSMQGILSANMPALSAVLAQASSAEAATKAGAADTAAAKKRVLRSKIARANLSESKPASFVSSYQLSVPLVLLRGAGVCADVTGKITVRHQSHRFPSLILPPSSCKPALDAPSLSALPSCKSKAAHIARHILCGSSQDRCEAVCAIDSRALSDAADVHKGAFQLVVETNDSSAEDCGTFVKVSSGGRMAAVAGVPVALTLHMNDRCMSPCLGRLEDNVVCSVRYGANDSVIHAFEACDIGLGRYVISFLPPMELPGVYSISCTVNNIHVEGSPFNVTVVPYEPAVTSASRLSLQPTHPCLPWPHCHSSPAANSADDPPTLVVTQKKPALVVSGWFAPFELYNEETARWVGNNNTVGDVDVVFVLENCLENQRLVESIR
jgi:hypothetical protein